MIWEKQRMKRETEKLRETENKNKNKTSISRKEDKLEKLKFI